MPRHSSVPFDLNFNQIYLQVRVNDSDPLWFIFDTGAQITVIEREVAAKLKLQIQGSVPGGGGAGENKVEISLAGNVSIRLPDIETPIPLVAIAPLALLLEPHVGRKVHGVLGFDFISKYVFEIDYAARMMRIHDPSSYLYSGSGTIIPISIVDNHPQVRATILAEGKGAVEGDFIVDTGAAGAIDLTTPFVDKHKFLTSGGPFFQGFVVGVGGVSKQSFGRLNQLRLGTISLEKPLAAFWQDRSGAMSGLLNADGIIGAEFLRRYTVIWDYSNKRMILEPNSHLKELYKPDMSVTSGMLIAAEGSDFRRFRIKAVIEDSPAGKAGLREGDQIVAFNNKPAEGFSLEQVRQLILNARSLRLLVKREEKRIEAILHPKQVD